MTKNARKGLFYGLSLLFLLLGSATVFYAQGWRFDFETFNMKKVGAIYVRSFPVNASISLNGKPIKNKNGLLDAGTFIGNLFPKNYKLVLKADGYRDWQEHIAIRPSLVSEIKYGVLVPKVPEPVEQKPVKQFWITNQGPIIKNEDNGLTLGDKKLAGDSVVDWTNDSRKILTQTESGKNYFLNDMSKGTTAIISLNPIIKNLGLNILTFKKISFDSDDGQKILAVAKNSIIRIDVNNPDYSVLYKNPDFSPIEFSTSRSWLISSSVDEPSHSALIRFYNRLSGEATTHQLPGSTRSTNSGQASSPQAGATKKIVITNDSLAGILQNDGELYLGHPYQNGIDKLASDVRDFQFSADGDFVAALEHKSLEVFSLKNKEDYWRFNLPNIENVASLEWYRDDNHLFIQYPNAVSFLDLNDRSLENFPTVAESSATDYNPATNKFYFMKDGGLWSLLFPL